MAIFNKQIKYSKEQLLDHYPKKSSPFIIALKYFYGLLRLLCIVIQNLYCVSSYLVLSWIVLLPLNWLKSDLYWKLENYLYNSLLFIVSSWSLAAETTVVESGDEFKHLIEEPERYYLQDSLQKQQSDTATKKCNSNRPQLTGTKEPTEVAGNGLCKSSVPLSKTTANGLIEVTTNKDKSITPIYSNKNKNSLPTSNGKRKLENGSFRTRKKSSQGICDAGDDVIDGLDESMSENGLESIEYQVELASAAGERKLTHHSFKKNNLAIQKNGLSNKTILNTSHNGSNSMSDSNSDSEHCTSELTSKSVQRQMGITYPITKASSETTPATIPIEALKIKQSKPRVLFLCNHISTADVPLIMQSFSSLTNQSLLWVLDAQFKPTNFGVVCSSHGDFFVAKNSFVDGSLREQVLRHPDRNLLVLFPEGGFLRKRIDGSNRYANRTGLPQTKYVTHPRFGAFKDLIDPSVGVTHIVDATLFYYDIKNPLSILDIVLGTRREPVVLDYKLYKMSEINPTEEWLRKIWLDKDKLLAAYYEDRNNLLQRLAGTLRSAQLDWFKILAVHLFYLLVCYLAIYRLFIATSSTMSQARELYYSNI